MKKIIALVLALVLTVAASVAGTVAYLQDEDSDVNVMTLGNVEIEQIEQEYNAEGKLVDFTQGKPLYPYVGELGWKNTETSNGAYRQFTMANVVDKYVSVKNTGKSDAYVRTFVALEMGDYTYDEFNMVGISINSVDGAEFDFVGSWEMVNDFVAEIDGKNYNVMEFVHQTAVAPGETTIPSLLQVYLSKDATNETVEKLDGNDNGTYDILVLSQAVQTKGFADAQTALDTAFPGSANKDVVAGWFNGMGNVKYIEANEQKGQIEGNIEDLESGATLIVGKKTDILIYDTNAVDAKGATVTLNGTGADAYGYLSFLPEAGEDVAVSNLNVTGSGFVEVGHYGQGGGDYTVSNMTIKDLESTLANGDKGFTLGCAFMAFGDAVLNDCVITGTTAKDGVMPVDLACGQAWSGYTDDDDNKISTTVNGGKYGTVYCWSHGIVTLNGAEIDTLYASPINGSVTIKAGTHVGTLNIDYGTSNANETRISKIVIEPGATIDAIVFKGVTYNTLDEVIASLS